MAMRHELANGSGRQANAVFVILDFLGHADAHGDSPQGCNGTLTEGESRSSSAAQLRTAGAREFDACAAEAILDRLFPSKKTARRKRTGPSCSREAVNSRSDRSDYIRRTPETIREG
jgi:hypothetical protein